MNFWILLAGALVFSAFSAGAWTLLQRWWPDAGVQRLAGERIEGSGLHHQRWTDRLPKGVLRLLGWLSRWSLPDTSTDTNTMGATAPCWRWASRS